MFALLLCLSAVLLPLSGSGQQISLLFEPVFQGDLLKLDEGFQDEKGDSICFHTLRFYVGNVAFFERERIVYQESRHFLLDLSDESSLALSFELPPKTEFDAIQFDFGVDSLTNISGVMGGDLDPANGMFWTWQSGYINCKLEGYYSKCPARNHEFQFHLGGYMPPFQAVQQVRQHVQKGATFQVQMDLSPFFLQLDWANQSSIMTPSKVAVELSRALAASFHVHR